MNKQYIFIIGFVVMALAQLFVPANMILSQEKTIHEGKVYKFKTAPVDPIDPIRGKYISLRYELNNIEIYSDQTFRPNEQVFVVISEDYEGFAKVDSVTHFQPAEDVDYVKADVQYWNEQGRQLTVRYPFTRFYMEESKALPAEKLVRAATRDENQTCYALIHVNQGNSVLEEVMIDDVPIGEAVELERELEEIELEP